MSKWEVSLSTTEPRNYVGIIKVRQGNIRTETLEVTITEKGELYDLANCRCTFQAKIGDQAIERVCNIAGGKVLYDFDEFTMQKVGRQFANICIYKGESLIGTTQDFSYFVIQAVSKTPSETGSYWASMDYLMEDMKNYINAGKVDFQNWFDSVIDILKEVDPGGKLLVELLDSRVDLSGVTHNSLKERLEADFSILAEKLKAQHYTLHSFDIEGVVLLQDDDFSKNHVVEKIDVIEEKIENGALVISNVDKAGVFSIEQVGEIQ